MKQITFYANASAIKYNYSSGCRTFTVLVKEYIHPALLKDKSKHDLKLIL